MRSLSLRAIGRTLSKHLMLYFCNLDQQLGRIIISILSNIISAIHSVKLSPSYNSALVGLSGRRPQWKMTSKTTSMEDDPIGRLPQRKMTSMEDDLDGRKPHWKMTSLEDKPNGR